MFLVQYIYHVAPYSNVPEKTLFLST